MNKRICNILWPLLLVCVLPAALLILSSRTGKANQYELNLTSVNTKDTTATTVAETFVQEHIPVVSVLTESSEIIKMPLEEYVFGVVLAEMPHWFEYEALKAQAVVARTYTLRRSDGNAKHKGAEVCTDPSCCQAYCAEEAYLASGGTTEAVDKIREAVRATANKVLVYNDELIEATYFSCSGGVTEDAAAVWGADVPYLQSTASPGEEEATYYKDSVYFSSFELEEILGRDIPGEPDSWFGEITYTNGGGVETIDIGEKTYFGTELRRLLGLRSTAFSVSTLGNTVLFITKGYGHRVGMSQYGADAMAATGKTCEEILLHYYSGTQLVNYKT